ncbi:MAG: methyltransferase [Flavobacteriales bacterium]|jgi:hypothetical protein|nr:methyltransferase [Flavobacteriales bacterium]
MDKTTNWRHKKTISFLSKHFSPPTKILDLGTQNTLSKKIQQTGYDVINTNGENLDIEYKSVLKTKCDLVTAFEIFEHMLAPFNILKEIKTQKLIASVPLKLWFANAYWNEHDDWDKHYHEFEVKQFDFLLQQTGWKIIDSEKWIPKGKIQFGIRPFLRMVTPRYYIVYCEKK